MKEAYLSRLPLCPVLREEEDVLSIQSKRSIDLSCRQVLCNIVIEKETFSIVLLSSFITIILVTDLPPLLGEDR